MIDTDLRAHLVGMATAVGNKVFTGNARQDTQKPFIVIRRSAGDQPVTLGGVRLLERAQFDVNVIADDYNAALPTANAIRVALHGFRGVIGTSNVRSCRCIVFPSDQSDVDGDRITRWVQATYLFVYSED